jgi:hypothetical protein
MATTLSKLPAMLKIAPKRKDINFFALRKKKQSIAFAGILVVLIPIALLGAMFAIYSYNSYQLTTLNNDLATASRNLAAINLKEKEPILERANLKRDIFATYYAWIDSLNTELGNFDIVPSQLIVDMRSLSDKITWTSLSARDNTLIFKGAAPTPEVIAEFQANCANIDGVKDTFISSIVKDTTITATADELYSFEMTLNFGKKDTADASEEADNADNQ